MAFFYEELGHSSISPEDTSGQWAAEAKQFVENMDRVPTSILLGAYGHNLTDICVTLKSHRCTCMCSGCQVLAHAQAIISSDDPKPN
eukprot:749750-Karenia_brevis.AAC.1